MTVFWLNINMSSDLDLQCIQNRLNFGPTGRGFMLKYNLSHLTITFMGEIQIHLQSSTHKY